MRGKGIAKRDGVVGDLLVTLQVAVPVADWTSKAKAALEAYAKATAGHDPRPELTAMLG